MFNDCIQYQGTIIVALLQLIKQVKIEWSWNSENWKDKNGKYSVKFGIYGIPESILINKELIIIQKFVGPLSVDDYNNIIKIIE